ncbi:MAG: hypothetical protein VX938_02205, partial [Myxococcota bacterium]|nr:hypothetical protein [Myxococcota bacterium]
TQSATTIKGVLEHNVHDVLSMITLTAYLGEAVRGCFVGNGPGRFGVNLGRLLLRRGRSAEAYAVLQAWLETRKGWPLEAERDGLRLLAIAARRQRDVNLQRATLERLVDISETDFQAMIDLAILEEHRARDLPRALAWAEAAHALEGDEDTTRRLARLRRRLGNAIGTPSYGFERHTTTQPGDSTCPGLSGVLDAMDRSP